MYRRYHAARSAKLAADKASREAEYAEIHAPATEPLATVQPAPEQPRVQQQQQQHHRGNHPQRR